ncbi:MAG: NAD(P)-binding domain-containing protein, partial [Bacilli bacterium]|nr:NAD(P)-binding domain-containing protein [Bacilli bacterium]
MNITVIGSGAFGFAIAMMLHKNGHKITIWTHSTEQANQLSDGNEEIIPGVKIPKEFKFTASYEEALKDSQIVFIMVAAKYVGDVAKNIAKY